MQYINFWIENAPPPLELFRKFIRFGRGKLPLRSGWMGEYGLFRTPWPNYQKEFQTEMIFERNFWWSRRANVCSRTSWGKERCWGWEEVEGTMQWPYGGTVGGKREKGEWGRRRGTNFWLASNRETTQPKWKKPPAKKKMESEKVKVKKKWGQQISG